MPQVFQNFYFTFQVCLIETSDGFVSDEELYSDSSSDEESKRIRTIKYPEKQDMASNNIAKNYPQVRECSVRLKRLPDTLKPRLDIHFQWIRPTLHVCSGKTFYRQVQTEQVISVGDFVRIRSDRNIYQVISLFEDKFEYFAHLREYIRGNETILSETSDDRELFQVRNVLRWPVFGIVHFKYFNVLLFSFLTLKLFLDVCLT